VPPPALHFVLFGTVVGDCILVWNDALQIAGAQLPNASTNGSPAQTRARLLRHHAGAVEAAPPPAVAAVIERLAAALEGAPDTLEDVALDMTGVPAFDQQVYALARRIPPGRVRTYGELARELGDPSVARAVGQALGRNPFAPLVPCHRVLAAGGQAGGFSAPGGLATKLKLLHSEGAQFGEQPGLF
jgi:methylated-DNA-[protein]-cysteine S-methyltransferase